MERWQFGYYDKDGNFFRRTIEAESLEAAIEQLLQDRPGIEITSTVQV